MHKLNVTAPTGEPLISMTRTFDAPRRLVWQAMTEAKHMARWWGPHGYTNKIIAFDVRPGGIWRIEQSDPAGRTFPFHGEFREVVAPERLVWTFGMDGMFDDRMVLETVTLTEAGKRTEYRATARFDTIADRDGMIADGMEWGASQGMERLDALLAEMMAVEKA